MGGAGTTTTKDWGADDGDWGGAEPQVSHGGVAYTTLLHTVGSLISHHYLLCCVVCCRPLVVTGDEATLCFGLADSLNY